MTVQSILTTIHIPRQRQQQQTLK